MNINDLRDWVRRAGDWAVRYRETVADRPVRPRVAPGSIAAQLPPTPPDAAEAMDAIFADFETVIMPGMTHWQHPRFFAYFPANAAPPTLVAEILASAVSAQCMLWQTSPAATELEGVVVDWLRQAVGLPDGFTGVLQDSASTATLAAVLTMRERALSWRGNAEGLAAHAPVRVYASGEVHSSLDKAIWISGIGQENLVKIPVAGPERGMDVAALRSAIAADRAAGRIPAGIVACVGGTSVGAVDDVEAVAAVAAEEGLYLHVDAAWAGAAMICPEFRSLWAGVERADSLVLNPHKWLGAPFECSAHFVREPESLVRTLAIRPEYLKTHGKDGIVNYSEWSVPLGRRFRALKLWFLIRAYGLSGLRQVIRDHVRWSTALAAAMEAADDFEIVTAPVLSLFSFRHLPAVGDVDAHNRRLIDAVNDDGRLYLTQTTVDGRFAIRFQAGSFETREEDVRSVAAVIREVAGRLG